MHAIIRQGDGKYYISPVFGYYKNVSSEDEYQRYLEEIHSPYYVVFNEQKTHLIKCFAMEPNANYLIPQVLIVDSDLSGWTADDEGIGGVDFLNREDADRYISDGVVPDAIMEKCLQAAKSYTYNEYPEILTPKDIKDFEWASGCFHDAYIKEKKILVDGSLYLKFDGIWGCEIEIWFWGDLEYSTDSRSAENSDPYWYSSSVILRDGFVYFVDEEGISVEKISDEYCWFKARHMKYHIIPD